MSSKGYFVQSQASQSSIDQLRQSFHSQIRTGARPPAQVATANSSSSQTWKAPVSAPKPSATKKHLSGSAFLESETDCYEYLTDDIGDGQESCGPYVNSRCTLRHNRTLRSLIRNGALGDQEMFVCPSWSERGLCSDWGTFCPLWHPSRIQLTPASSGGAPGPAYGHAPARGSLPPALFYCFWDTENLECPLSEQWRSSYNRDRYRPDGYTPDAGQVWATLMRVLSAVTGFQADPSTTVAKGYRRGNMVSYDMDSFQALGVSFSLIDTGSKAGSVDGRIKTDMGDLKADLCAGEPRTPADPCYFDDIRRWDRHVPLKIANRVEARLSRKLQPCFVVLLSGDCDFNHDITTIRDKAKVPVIVVGNVYAKSTYADIATVFLDWQVILDLASARKAGLSDASGQGSEGGVGLGGAAAGGDTHFMGEHFSGGRGQGGAPSALSGVPISASAARSRAASRARSKSRAHASQHNGDDEDDSDMERQKGRAVAPVRGRGRDSVRRDDTIEFPALASVSAPTTSTMKSPAKAAQALVSSLFNSYAEVPGGIRDVFGRPIVGSQAASARTQISPPVHMKRAPDIKDEAVFPGLAVKASPFALHQPQKDRSLRPRVVPGNDAEALEDSLLAALSVVDQAQDEGGVVWEDAGHEGGYEHRNGPAHELDGAGGEHRGGQQEMLWDQRPGGGGGRRGFRPDVPEFVPSPPTVMATGHTLEDEEQGEGEGEGYESKQDEVDSAWRGQVFKEFYQPDAQPTSRPFPLPHSHTRSVHSGTYTGMPVPTAHVSAPSASPARDLLDGNFPSAAPHYPVPPVPRKSVGLGQGDGFASLLGPETSLRIGKVRGAEMWTVGGAARRKTIVCRTYSTGGGCVWGVSCDFIHPCPCPPTTYTESYSHARGRGQPMGRCARYPNCDADHDAEDGAVSGRDDARVRRERQQSVHQQQQVAISSLWDMPVQARGSRLGEEGPGVDAPIGAFGHDGSFLPAGMGGEAGSGRAPAAYGGRLAPSQLREIKRREQERVGRGEM